MFSARMRWGESRHTREQLDFVSGRFGIAPSRFYDLESRVALRMGVLHEPYGRKMTPPELSNNAVPIVIENVVDLDW